MYGRYNVQDVERLCERSFIYYSVFSIFLVARYAQWFPMENHGNFGAPYLEF